MDEWIAALRQLRFPRALRIPPVRAFADPSGWDALIASLEYGAAAARKADVLDTTFARSLGNLTWGVQKRAAEISAGEDRDWLGSRLDLMRGTLRTQGLEILDYSGSRYDANEIWDEVVGREGVKRAPIIVSMLKPRLLLKGTIIQRGTPVVADDGTAEPGSDDP